jgi:hypothetical protein
MRESDDGFFVLHYHSEALLKPDDPTDDLLKYQVELVPLLGGDGEPGPCVGSFSVWRFNIAAYKERGWPTLLHLFDDDSEEAADLYEALFDTESEDYNQAVTGDLVCFSDLLYFQQARFDENMKRSPLLLAMAERIIETLGGGCGFAALWLGDEPYPKRDDCTVERVLEFWDSQQENERFWSRIGFSRLTGTFFLIRNLAISSPRSIHDILDDDCRSQ